MNAAAPKAPETGFQTFDQTNETPKCSIAGHAWATTL